MARLSSLLSAIVIATGFGVQGAHAEWSPDRQYSIASQKCAASYSAMDKDECQYLAEMLIDDLGSCAAKQGPYASRCATMLPGARAMLATVNSDPVLLDHRARQRRNYQDSITGAPARGPSGFMPVPNPQRNCVPVQGQWMCN